MPYWHHQSASVEAQALDGANVPRRLQKPQKTDRAVLTAWLHSKTQERCFTLNLIMGLGKIGCLLERRLRLESVKDAENQSLSL